MTKKEKVKILFTNTKKHFIDRINFLYNENRIDDALAVRQELREWLLSEKGSTMVTIKNLIR